MELRYWLGEALTGDLGPEVRVQGTPQFTSRFGGGPFQADIMLGDLRTLTGERDAAALREVLSWTGGGKFTFVATYGDICVGEWLIWRADEVQTDGPVTVRGFELDGYPAFRSINDDYKYTDGDQGAIAARLLRDAFYSYQDFQITVPWPIMGITRSIDHKSHTAYYSEVLEEISAPTDGFQWRVVPQIERFNDNRPVKVSRRVVFGQPTLRQSSLLRLYQADEGARYGNVLSFPRPARDFSKYAQSVYGFGRGQGAKQQWVGLSDPTLTNQGHLIVTKNVTFSEAATPASLTALTRAALVEAQELREPASATVIADKANTIPRVGDVVPVEVRPNHAWPDGFIGDLQVGQVDLRPNGNHLETFTLLGI